MDTITESGIAANGSVNQAGHHIAGRDLTVHEGLRIRTKFRTSAKRCLLAGLSAMLAGTGLFGYYVIAFYVALDQSMPGGFDDPKFDDFPDMPSALPWVPGGFGLNFLGVALLIVGLFIPRDRLITKD
ncbi:MAG: hypothetical protein ACKVWR_03500 [Acidimicrobiales bacterium]